MSEYKKNGICELEHLAGCASSNGAAVGTVGSDHERRINCAEWGAQNSHSLHSRRY